MGVGTLDHHQTVSAAVRMDQRLAVLCGQRNALDAALVALVAEVLECGAWEEPGVTSPAHWLVWKAGLSSAHAHQIVRMARRRGELPATFGAFDAGELSADQVTPVVDTAPSYADRELCEMARQMTVPQLRRVVRAFDTPEPTDRAEATAEQLSMSRIHGGRWQVRGELDADHGAVLDAALREARDALFHRDGHPASRAEALVEISHRSLDAVTEPARRDRFRVHIHIDTAGDAVGELGHRLPDWLRGMICCDTILSMVIHDHGIPVSVGRAQRSVPERTRRLVILRDRGCRAPGCAADRFLDVHHVIHWDPADGAGPTDTWNLASLCRRHHRMHHQGALGITGNADLPDGLVFTDTHGSVLHPGPRPRRPTGPPPPPVGHYRHPLGERLQLRWIAFNPPPEPPTTGDGN